MNEPTPLMIQYGKIKSEYPNDVLFFRLGDFYEMFDDDAREVSRLLNLTLTHRGDSPMCGIPFHAAKVYIARLLRFGKRIAICEQVGLPPNGKGLAERKVIEVITPGTVIEEEYLEGSVNNYLASLCLCKGKKENFVSFSYIDISTGDFAGTSWKESQLIDFLQKELGRVQPKELILSKSLFAIPAVQNLLHNFPSIVCSDYPDWHFSLELCTKTLLHQFQTIHLSSFGLKEDSPEIASSGFLLDYLKKTTNTGVADDVLLHVQNFRLYKDSEFVVIDDASRKNLELVQNLRDGSTQFSLLDTLSYGITPMGNRLIRSWIVSPLKTLEVIHQRQKDVTFFYDDSVLLQDSRQILKQILDIQRLASRIALDRAHAKDILALKQSLCGWLILREKIKNQSFSLVDCTNAKDIVRVIENSICEDPATSLTEGRLIKRGWSEELDHFHEVKENFNQILDNYLEEEKKTTGISNLKVRYNRIIGYYLEVSKGKLDFVPAHFILRRALVNGDRYTTERLQELEHELLSAGEKIIELEKNLFLQIRNGLKEYLSYLLQIAQEVAYIDTVASFAYAARLQKWVCPKVEDSTVFEITEGRHPVVEKYLPSGEFVPNDTSLSDKFFALITGPNMAGKSTYLRQNALIVLMAQIGSFVPAKKATLGIVDAIFCRVGASDNLARGESTFLVEMSETAHILRCATEKSLIIMDEVGRGTSTEDGLSIAWAISEYLLNTIKAKTFFATHYHELTRLQHENLKLLCLDVVDDEEKITFLKKIKEGASENSYGIHVASLAGIPSSVLERAKDILSLLQKDETFNSLENKIETKKEEKKSVQVGLFSEEELVLNEIISLDVNELTPLNALQKIAQWKKVLFPNG